MQYLIPSTKHPFAARVNVSFVVLRASDLQAWRQLGISLEQIFAPLTTEDRIRALKARNADASIYAQATFLKWNCALAMQATCSNLDDFVARSAANTPGDEFFGLLGAQCHIPLELAEKYPEAPMVEESVPAGLLLLRRGWNRSLLLEYLATRGDLRSIYGIGIVPALLDAAVAVAQLAQLPTIITESAVTSQGMWSKYLSRSLGEFCYASTPEAREAVSNELKELKITPTVTDPTWART